MDARSNSPFGYNRKFSVTGTKFLYNAYTSTNVELIAGTKVLDVWIWNEHQYASIVYRQIAADNSKESYIDNILII